MNRLHILGGLLAAGLVLTAPTPTRAQEFLGKAMGEWQKDLDPSKTEAQRRSAAFALGKIGKKAVPALGDLAARLDDPDAGVREAAAFSIGEICGQAKTFAPEIAKALCERLKKEDENPLVRRSAAFALGSMGKADATVRAAMNAGLKAKDAAVRQNVAWALGRLGEESVPAIRQALKDEDPLVRRDAANAVAQVGGDAYEAKPELLACLTSDDVELRKAAAAAMARIVAPEDMDARGPLLKLLNDPQIEIKQNAALGLGSIGGAESKPAIPVLLDLLKNRDPDPKRQLELKRAAALAFKNLGKDAAEAVPELRKALFDPDETLRHNAAVAFIGFKETGIPAVPDLLKIVGDRKESARVRQQAAVALSRIGYNDELVKGLPTLLDVIADKGDASKVRERAMWPIRLYLSNSQDKDKVYKTLVNVLTEPLTPNHKMLQYDCAYVLGVFQKTAAPEKAVDILLEFLKDNTIKIYGGVGGSGSSVGESGGTAGSATEKGVDDGRIMAVDALGQISPQRVAKRMDVVTQLRALHTDPKTLLNLQKGLKQLMPEVEKEVKNLK